MGIVLKKDREFAEAEVTRAASFGAQVAAEKGLTVLNGETPTDYQTGVASLHAREDTAALILLASTIIVQQQRTHRWIKAIAAMTLLCLLGTCAINSQAADRSRILRAEFQRSTPCPSTGKSRGACPGYQVDHREALICGGRDELGNLQWLTVEEHRAKTRVEVKLCRPAKTWRLNRGSNSNPGVAASHPRVAASQAASDG